MPPSATMRVELLGTSFEIRTDEDPEYVRNLVRYYEQRVRDVRGSVPTNDMLRVAILAGILLADELHKSGAVGEKAQEMAEADRITARLITALDAVIPDDGAHGKDID